MRLKVLGCSGAEFPNFHTPAFLIDDELLLDAGTIGAVLSEEDQWAIKYILITHTHLDHIKGIPFLADNIIIKHIEHTVTVASTRENLQVIRDHLLNNVIWPDFTMIPSVEAPVIEYMEIEPDHETLINGYTVTAYRVNHSVPAVGYIVRKGDKALLYTGDTGPTDKIWRHAVGLSAMIIEVSLPNEMEQMALLTGHLTPHLLAGELRKLSALPPRILITHLKLQYYSIIKAELQALDIPQIELLHDGNVYDL